jgi:hypothetical protein
METVINFAIYVFSVGVSDLIEFYTNPDVHMFHDIQY